MTFPSAIWYNDYDYNPARKPSPDEGRRGDRRMKMRFYIPMGDDRYLCIENGKPTRVVRGEPDPFSRIARPDILWSRVQEDLPRLPKREIGRAKRSKIAYTRLWEER